MSGLDERPIRQLRRQIPHNVGTFSGKCRIEALVMRFSALARVLARGPAVDQEGPVGALQREQLAQGAIGGTGAERGQLRTALPPGELAAPGAQVAPAA